jgi:putative zinc finger/helix-turn-helix YgiT family protein
MTCPQCDSAALQSKHDAEHAGNYRGAEVVVTMPGLVCPNCSFVTIHGRDMGRFQQLVREAYGEKRSGEIKGIRERWRMSQKAFAKFTGFGIASIKRWESGQIPDANSDEWIKARSDVRVAETIVQETYWRLNKAIGALAELPKLESVVVSNWDPLRNVSVTVVNDVSLSSAEIAVSWSTVQSMQQMKVLYGPDQEPAEQAREEYALCA